MEILINKSGKPVDTQEGFAKRREEIKEYLAENIYGRLPERPKHLKGDTAIKDTTFAAGAGILREISLTLTVDGSEFKMPLRSVTPSGNGKYPAFIYVDYESNVPSKYLPAEEIINRGYAIFCLSYNDICGKDDDFKSGISKFIAPTRRRKDSPGKITLLVWAILRTLEFAVTLPYIDSDNIAVIGHGTLARAALVAGGYDERIKYIILNNFEFGESYLSRPYLFGKNFWENADGTADKLALALCAPRHIMVGAAIDDCISDNQKGLENLISLNEVYSLFGKSGLPFECNSTDEPFTLRSDSIFYRLRSGPVYLSRKDWNAYIDYINDVNQL